MEDAIAGSATAADPLREMPLSSLLKKGTGSEPTRINAAKKGEREVPVPLFQQAVSLRGWEIQTLKMNLQPEPGITLHGTRGPGPVRQF
jgi:hypothetical protein